MVPPKSSHDITSPMLGTPHLTYINDFGGKPTMTFQCKGNSCAVTGEQ
ncbi:hypothetical protein PROPEN_04077 [Proteus penneri ATCC 35198]|nr:hypothetical protein PROPEN_04077 [Proteus penneri ATCC 35198]